MSIITEEQVAKLQEAGIKVPDVNQDCIGCSACVAIEENVFELNDEGKSEVVFHENYEGFEVDDSISACPVDAISWK